ncbi:MAG TPA: SDR family NAD(P)-dependent oxidoreductase, partial [Gemmatales bacterium]|nr:SDR family NAD(P)-dependent oxidoreductase [Gemmatales bacterium]
MGMFTGKVALVTGGTSGIGRATAIAFAREGARVLVTGRREKEGSETVRLLREAGSDGCFLRADVRQEDEVTRVVEHAVHQLGQLDFAFNNAGTEGMPFVPTHQQTVEHYREVFDSNVLGVLLCMKHEIRAMQLQGGGVIVNNASAVGVVGMAGMAVYSASKHAVVGLT